MSPGSVPEPGASNSKWPITDGYKPRQRDDQFRGGRRPETASWCDVSNATCCSQHAASTFILYNTRVSNPGFPEPPNPDICQPQNLGLSWSETRLLGLKNWVPTAECVLSCVNRSCLTHLLSVRVKAVLTALSHHCLLPEDDKHSLDSTTAVTLTAHSTAGKDLPN